ncbi:hypothetical protein AB5J62_25035 [Amycolatopsis sp. cg5]|uniref:nSTAND1 domain-containing NTPase n=1 Tax=Amycolatopsis sp. cg5 TaxID=3238802 RepID=UPI003523FD86
MLSGLTQTTAALIHEPPGIVFSFDLVAAREHHRVGVAELGRGAGLHERVVADLVGRLAATTPLFVVGPSGVGKSSLLGARLIPPGGSRLADLALCDGDAHRPPVAGTAGRGHGADRRSVRGAELDRSTTSGTEMAGSTPPVSR